MAFPLFFCKEITLGSVEDSLVHEQSQISSRDQHTRPFLKYVLSNVRWLGDSAAAWWATTNSWLSSLTLSDILSFSKKVFEAWRLDSAIFQIWLTKRKPSVSCYCSKKKSNTWRNGLKSWTCESSWRPPQKMASLWRVYMACPTLSLVDISIYAEGLINLALLSLFYFLPPTPPPELASSFL